MRCEVATCYVYLTCSIKLNGHTCMKPPKLSTKHTTRNMQMTLCFCDTISVMLLYQLLYLIVHFIMFTLRCEGKVGLFHSLQRSITYSFDLIKVAYAY